MTAVEWLEVAVIGGVAAIARFGLDRAVTALVPGGFPTGTFVVNISGCLMLGLLSGLAVGAKLDLLLGSAALGSYTTFSTWVFETQRLGEERRLVLALGNLLLSAGLGLLVAWVGLEIGGAL
jgi:CrcB protein